MNHLQFEGFTLNIWAEFLTHEIKTAGTTTHKADTWVGRYKA